MNFAFQKQALFGTDQIFPLIVDSGSIVSDAPVGDGESGWASGWIPYSGQVSTHCAGPMHGESNVSRVFLSVQTEWFRRSGKIVHKIVDALTGRGGGHLLVAPSDKLYALLDSYRQSCGVEFTTDEQSAATFDQWKAAQAVAQAAR